MIEARTIARPYAEAALEHALEMRATKEWSTMLATLAAIVSNNDAIKFVKNPQLTSVQKTEFMTGVAEKSLASGGENFVHLLADNGRLLILPEINQLYQEMLAKREKRITALVKVARPLTEQQAQGIIAALKKRFNSDVTITTEIDETLLAGALIRVGDLVIDGTLRGRYTRLAEELLN
ncbi:MAG: F0F1 ATP synthase subunit delta [Pseudomonadota bacterium]|nr:F0F1 ATP synthase subunit delta [Pseudomonadota bacterium]